MRGSIHRTSIGSYDYANKASDLFGVNQGIFILTFASVAIVGQVGQNVVLPIWFGSVPDPATESFDGYFVLLYTCAWFTFIFFLCFLTQLYVFEQCTWEDVHYFTQPKFLKQDFFVAFFTALNGLFVVFAAPGGRTPAFLQTVFSNVLIPFVLVIRFVVLRKCPNCIQFLCSMGVLIGLFITAYPSLFDVNPTKAMETKATGAWRVLWPMCFLFGFLPAALYTVFEEKYLQQENTGGTNDEPVQPISLFLVLVTAFQTLTFVFFFWVDAVPTYGFAPSVGGVWMNFAQSFRWSWGLDGAGFKGPLGCWMFILMYCLQNFGAAMLLRYTEGATWTALVQALVTPIGELFWVLFNSPEDFGWKPKWSTVDFYALGGLVIMMPCVYIYNLYSEEGDSGKDVDSHSSYVRAAEGASVNLRSTDRSIESEGYGDAHVYGGAGTSGSFGMNQSLISHSKSTSLPTPQR